LNKATTERLYPVVMGIVCAAYTVHLPNTLKCRMASTLGEPMLGVMATLVGFLAAITAILTALPHNRTIEWLKETHALSTLVSYARSAIYFAFLSAALSAVIVYFREDSPSPPIIASAVSTSSTRAYVYVVPLWTGFCAASWACAYRFAHLIFRLLEG